MRIDELYPIFTLTDAYGRKLRFSREGTNYYREWLNSPFARQHKTPDKRQVSRYQYAGALLIKLEEIATGKPSETPVPESLFEPETDDRDEHFDTLFPRMR